MKCKWGNGHAKEVWERHGKHDTYMTMDEIRALAKKHIPTAKIKRKLFLEIFISMAKVICILI